ncbi:hypothetical protein [Streptomyces sp. NPDC017520]
MGVSVLAGEGGEDRTRGGVRSSRGAAFDDGGGAVVSDSVVGGSVVR